MFLRRISPTAALLLAVLTTTDGVFVAVGHRHGNAACEGTACKGTVCESERHESSAGHQHSCAGGSHASHRARECVGPKRAKGDNSRRLECSGRHAGRSEGLSFRHISSKAARSASVGGEVRSWTHALQHDCVACRYWSLRQIKGETALHATQSTLIARLPDERRIVADSPSLVVCRQRGPPCAS